jgi:hypothetical protein
MNEYIKTDFESFSMEVTFCDVNPERIKLLTGQDLKKAEYPTFALEIWQTHKRTFWQWLRRRPKPVTRTYIPRARIEAK